MRQVGTLPNDREARRFAAWLVAQRIDSRFSKDGEYPNQWRPVKLSEDGKYDVGTPTVYAGVGSYGRAIPLAQPAGTILFEFHLVFEEPHEWFDGVNLIRSKLPLAVQDQLRTFRRKLPAGK